MTDGGQIPSEGQPEHLLPEAGSNPAQGGGGWGTVPVGQGGPVAASGPVYHFIDQPDDEDDLLLMPGPQGSWSDGATPAAPLDEALLPGGGFAPLGYPAAGEGAPVAPPAQVPGAPVPVAAEAVVAPTGVLGAPVGAVPPGAAVPSAPAVAPAQSVPLAPPVPLGAPAQPVPSAPSAEPVAAALAVAVAEQPPGTPVEPSWPPLEPPAVAAVTELPLAQAQQAAAQQVRRPLHAGPPIPDPSLMTGQVPVRSLADRGPSAPGGTPPHGVPVVAVPAQMAPVELVAAAPPVAPVAPAPVEQPVAVQVPAQAVAAEAVVDAPSTPVEQAAQPVAQAVPAAVEQPADQATAVTAPAQPVPPAAPAPAAPTPAAPAPQAGHPRRIAAFLADPAPLGLAVAEAVAEPVTAPTATTAAVTAPEPAAAPAPEQPAAATVAEPVAPAVEEPAAQVQVQVQAEAEHAPAVEQPPAAEAVASAVAEAAVAEAAVAEAVAVEPAAVQQAVEQAPAPVVETPAEPVAAAPAPPAEVPAAPEPPAEAAEPAEPEAPRPPAAPGYEEAMREAVHQVMRERRDIRNGFRPDPVPHEVLLRVLEAAHTAPSVGYSQPWDFVVIRSAETRRKMHELAARQRDAYADSLPKGRAKQFKEIKIEAILDTPVNIVVTADRTRGGRHTLGRHTQPQMAPYSAALAVENLWLAARAEGLGVGWVSFFDEEEMVRELGLPEHLDVVAYLCVGYVDAFPDEPELQQQGWAKKRPLAWVVHEEQYGNRALPGEEPHSLLSDTLRTIRPLDAKALGEAWDRQKRMTKPAGSLGMLEIISAQLSGLSRKCPPPVPEPACVAIFAGDHGVHAQGVTPWPQEVTAQMVANFLAGGAVVNSFAAQVGAEVCVVDVGVKAELPEAIQQGRTTGLLPRKVKPGTDDMTQGPAMSREEALKALEVGIETARDLVAAGNKILITGDMGIANTTASAALISVITGADPAEVTGRGTGIDDETHARKVEVVRRALELHRPDPADPIGVLAAVGGLEHAAIAGFLLGAASLRTPVILDGVIAGSAALVAKAIAPEVLAACIAGHRSAEPGHQAALAKLGLRPLIDLDLRLGEGTGALLALPLVQSAARAMHDVATFDSAGVTEKG
ncbi:5,6-dimethylbenzimidazole synthase [Streptomyces tateyamensis]|uniref:Nicotinate-nucleotide--dimethylbenzimidazole phosphoribosyltransferase n=1 Tax=Streptomyces tateyamensis TaxID=565073 RepID=A0A2V4MYT7_9ACTN|nr:nicotinate-nucleotide--dimethylbenzimidazole phosphoribosyltransferase [Streptomyces tateyamensis]PYC76713.1 5,6-dimethylbenzimidazole synthase [Streptomyces tateyamensis]